MTFESQVNRFDSTQTGGVLAASHSPSSPVQHTQEKAAPYSGAEQSQNLLWMHHLPSNSQGAARGQLA